MESSEFDAALGGTEQLPYSANSLKFAASRSIEIAAMTESITRPSKTKLIFQSLPVHMRRRVMSHNCKRLPRKLREDHMEQLRKSGLPQKQKKPSRKYRRRPTNLLDEYNRRQKKNIWLETHIWHAKRFHMVKKWGHCLPHRPCDKAFRACYRASSTHCLMQDISYFIPIQIKGAINNIKDMFTLMTNSSCGLTITAKAFLSGNREGMINLYKPNAYPFGFIGKVNFLWLPSDISIKELWLFIHPAQAKEVEKYLMDIKNGNNCNYTMSEQIKRRKVINKYSDIQIQVISNINRFRLTGPRSHAILVQTLQSINCLDNLKHHKWVEGAVGSKQCLFLKEQNNYWFNIKSVSSPSQLPPKIVVSLIVKDPRLSRPPKRIKAQPERKINIDTDILKMIPPYLALSPLWDPNVRDIIKDDRVTNAKFIEHITETQLVPGEINLDDPTLQCLPIVLIQRPGSQDSNYKKIAYGSGWDIIIPAGYSLPFWLTFVMFGARSGGLRETESIAFELGENYYSPDSEAGILEEKRMELELSEKFFKCPPSKRVNYIKLSMPSPFICPWQVLLRDWGNDKEMFYVLRDKEAINELQECINNKKRSSQEKNVNCLVGVYLQIFGKGDLLRNATICTPDLTDITNKKTIFEPHHEDYNAELRKQKRCEHRKNLKKIRRKKIKSNKSKNVPVKKPEPKEDKKNRLSEYILSMRELWLPSNIRTVRNSGIRQTMGYIVHGGFSFSEAKSCGVGYIAFNALQDLLEKGINKVLIRNTTSRCYRLANFELIKSP